MEDTGLRDNFIVNNMSPGVGLSVNCMRLRVVSTANVSVLDNMGLSMMSSAHMGPCIAFSVMRVILPKVAILNDV